jgi:NADP-dependent 3-hydroxy acid dehydrogenase YdfG
MSADDIARAIFDIYQLPRRATVEEIILRPQAGDL